MPESNLDAKSERVFAIMQEANLDPRQGMRHPLVVEVAQRWAKGELNDLELMKAFRNLTILSNWLCLDRERKQEPPLV